MAEPDARRVPWGLLLTIGLLVVLVVLLYRASSSLDQPASWRVVFAVAVAASGIFLVLRRLQNYFWGVVAALTLILHPVSVEWASGHEPGLLAEACELLVLAAVTAGWSLAPLPHFAWRSWLLAALAVVVGNGLAWPAVPQARLVAAMLSGIGLLLAALWPILRHRERPAWANLSAAVLLGLGGPVAGLLLACGMVRVLDWPVSAGLNAESGALDFLEAALSSHAVGVQLLPYAGEQMQRWAWPAVWVVLPLLVLGLWCAVRRGLKAFRGRRPPLPWILVLYASLKLAGLMLSPRAALSSVLLPLAMLALLFAVFGIAEVTRALTRPLVLPPPGERMAEE